MSHAVGDGSGSDAPSIRPAVVPRARRSGESSQLPIDQLIAPLLDHLPAGLVLVTAPSGGGKTTALQYLRTILPPTISLRLFDADQAHAAYKAAESSLAILACAVPVRETPALAILELCPWTIDDCVEYLAARHRQRIRPVLDLLGRDGSVDWLAGSPALLVLVMDRMAADATLTSARQVLRQFTRELAIEQSLHAPLMVLCLSRLGLATEVARSRRPHPPDLSVPWLAWFRHAPVQRVFLAELIAQQLARHEIPGCLHSMSARLLLDDIAPALAHHPGSSATLQCLIADDPNHPAVAMAASLLLAAQPEWRPATTWPLNLSGSVLRNAHWTGIDLANSSLIDADFTGADLTRANLSQVDARRAILERAALAGARLAAANLSMARCAGADFSSAALENAQLQQADFTDAIFTRADLTDAELDEATLAGAVLQSARLRFASLEKVEVANADFTLADLTAATLAHVAMHRANWDQAVLQTARLLQCNLEGMEICDADFTRADLTGSLLTASRFPGARFYGAKLTSTGLAEIEWEGADLRNADLTHASFHLGSSRSGLVGSTIPCEGSRTGFYTDEFNDQDFKSPEEIRKACLCGADLRGATLERTDFYLVDLRKARYTAEQRRHFVHCGAILTPAHD